MNEVLFMMNLIKLLKDGGNPYETASSAMLIFATILANKDKNKEGLDDLSAIIVGNISVAFGNFDKNPQKAVDTLEAAKVSISDIQTYLKNKNTTK